MEKSIREKIEELLNCSSYYNDPQIRNSVYVMCLCLLEIDKNLCLLRKEVKMLKWFIASILILIVISVLR